MTSPERKGFTDEDLKLWEREHQSPRSKALLARLEAAERGWKWLEGLVELAEETLKLHQLGGQTKTEMLFREQHGRLRIDEIKRDLEAYRRSKGEAPFSQAEEGL